MGRYKKSLIKGASIHVPNMTVYEYLCRRSKLNTSPILAVCHEDNLTLKRLKQESTVYAESFLRLGIKEGDIVPICLPPCIEGIIAFFALNRIGAVATFLESTAGKDEIIYYLKYFSAYVFVASARLVEMLPEVMQDSGVSHIIVISAADAFGQLPTPCLLTQELLRMERPVQQKTGILTLNDFLSSSGNISMVSDISERKNAPALISFTSGTIGEPKAILLSNGNIIAELISEKKSTHMQFGPRGKLLQTVPFNYPYGFLISTLLPMFAGKTAALTPALKIDNFREYLLKYKPLYICGIPPLYSYLVREKEKKKINLAFLKYPISGGDKIDISEKKRINNFLKSHGCHAKVLDGSGNGEGGGALTNAAALFRKYNPASIGKANYGISIKFTDLNGEIVPLGQTGLFCFSGENVMVGYYKDSEATAKVKYKDTDGIEWVQTDTLGHMDKFGWIYFDGRERRFFITFDENGSPFKVYCDHVQEVIGQSDMISACAVVQQADLQRSFVPIAFLVPAKDVPFTKACDSVRTLCAHMLQTYAQPVAYRELSEIPLTRAGKVDYRALERLATLC